MGERGEREYDPRRREFFRNFGRQTVRSAGAVVAAADELRRAGGDAARELMDFGSVTTTVPQTTRVEQGVARIPAETFRSPYRATDDGLILVDQRELPRRVAMVTVREPSEIASAIRLGVVNAGPALGEIVAYGVARAVANGAAAGLDRDGLARSVATAAATLHEARHDVHAIGSALDRMAGYFREFASDERVDGDALAPRMHAEADRIASENALSHAALGRAAAAQLGMFGESVTLLVHGDCGPLSFGLVGPLTAALQSLAARETAIHVYVTEGAPTNEGARLATQLAQIDIPHTVIPDTAVAWLLAERHVDAAALRADHVCTNGDLASVVGSLNVAVVAEQARVPVFAIAPSTAFNPSMPDRAALAAELRWPAPDATSGPVGTRLNPGSDIVPSWLIERLLTAAEAA